MSDLSPVIQAAIDGIMQRNLRAERDEARAHLARILDAWGAWELASLRTPGRRDEWVAVIATIVAAREWVGTDTEAAS